VNQISLTSFFISFAFPFKLLILLSFSQAASSAFMRRAAYSEISLVIPSALTMILTDLANKLTHYPVFLTFLFYQLSAVSITLISTLVSSLMFWARFFVASSLP